MRSRDVVPGVWIGRLRCRGRADYGVST
jgi:hypothetical protein